MSDVLIEPMDESHLREVLSIEGDLFESPWTDGMFRQEMAGGRMSHPVVALSGGRVVGYLIAWFLRDEVHLLNVAVARAHQRKGYARRMLAWLIERASERGCESITLEVRESNLAAIRLYETFAFFSIGRRKDYYQNDHEDAIVMLLDLRSRGASRG